MMVRNIGGNLNMNKGDKVMAKSLPRLEFIAHLYLPMLSMSQQARMTRQRGKDWPWD